MMGFYGIGYRAMRQWAQKEIAAFVKRFPDWKQCPLKNKDDPKGPDAVWFNLGRTTEQEGNWYESPESRQDVITVAGHLYQKLANDGILDENFNPNNYKGSMKNESTIETVKSLLNANLNVILTGAPGTGKTYTARQVAEQLVTEQLDTEPLVTEQLDTKALSDDEQAGLSDDEQKEAMKKRKEDAIKNRIECVQFHPGYDYSDFVIGMKPVLLSKKGKELERKNGKYVEVESRSEIEEGKVGNAQVSFRWKDGIFKKFADDAQKAFDAWVATDGHKPEDAPKYVFLIDEINRADLSRVFGELFSLLEEEYRYPNDNGTGITLPNGEYFVIPRNLYILGTMNDIDRSVESMDFALRRRFAWHEVTAQQSADIIGKKVSEPTAVSALVNAMQNLNAVIDGDATLKLGDGTETYLRLGTAYQLGGAIFAQYEEYAGGEDPFGKLWRNHIENILAEYLRGQSNRDDLLKELERVYRQSVGIAQA